MQANLRANGRINAGDVEHLGMLTAGIALVSYGVTRRSWAGLVVGALGGAMLLRGASGYRRLYDLVGLDFPDRPSQPVHRLITVERSIMIDRPADEIYRFWRNLENLPQFMSSLEDVIVVDEKRSHWVAKAPAGMIVEWDADIVNDVPNHILAWKSREGSDVDNAGSVTFREMAEGTEVTVRLRYLPPGDFLGHGVAKFFHADPGTQLEDDLQRLKVAIESGEAAQS